MTALDFICKWESTPCQMHGNFPRKASNSDIRRWLENGSILINGQKPKPKDIVNFPIEQLIFFPNNPKKRCTQYDYDKADERSLFYEMKLREEKAILDKICTILVERGYFSFHIENFKYELGKCENDVWFLNVVAQLNLDGDIGIHEFEFELDDLTMGFKENK